MPRWSINFSSVEKWSQFNQVLKDVVGEFASHGREAAPSTKAPNAQ